MQHASMQTGNIEEETLITNLLNAFVPYPSSPIPRMSYWPSREREPEQEKDRKEDRTAAT